MLKSINKLTNYSSNSSVNSSINTCYLFMQFNKNINNNFTYYSKKNNINTNNIAAIKRNSYTHQQDVRKIKRRDLRNQSDNSDKGENDIVITVDNDTTITTTPPQHLKPSHIHSKPITHSKKLEQLENHHQKKLERDEKFKEEQRLSLINSLKNEKEELHKKQKEKEKIEQNQLEQQTNENSKKIIKRQLTQQQRLKQIQYGLDTIPDTDETTTTTIPSTDGKPEYSSLLPTEEDLSTFETDLSSYDFNKINKSSSSSSPSSSSSSSSAPFDLSKIDQNNIIDMDEMDLSNFEIDPTVNDETQVMTIEEAHKRFNFSEQELEMLYAEAKEQQQQQDEEHANLENEILEYERILQEKKEKLKEKESRKQFNSELKQLKFDDKQQKKLKKQQEKEQKKLEKQLKRKQYKLQEQEQSVDGVSTKNISSTQIDLIEKQKVIQHIQELHNKKVKEANVKERDLTPIEINEVMEFLAQTHLDDFCVIDISKKCEWTKYLVVASSDSVRLLSNTEDDIISNFKHRFDQLSSNSQNSDEWRVIDLKTVVIHLFETKTREHYDLETLWVTRREKDWKFEESWDDELTGKIELSLEDD